MIGLVPDPGVDSDGDGVADALEFQVGTDPNDAGSVDLAAVLTGIQVTPSSVQMVIDPTTPGSVSRQLAVIGTMTDDNTLNLAGHSNTNYSSSNLTVVNFGATPAEIFAGASGTATVTVTHLGFTDTVDVTVTQRSTNDGVIQGGTLSHGWLVGRIVWVTTAEGTYPADLTQAGGLSA